MKAQMRPKVQWPNGYKFAFTIVDDTDAATLANVKPVYDLLVGLGIKTTKTVWVFRGNGATSSKGATCEDADYLDWLLLLQRQGFEIGFHNAAPATSTRETTILALERFHSLFGNKEILFCNHGGCREDIYWGQARLSGWRRCLYNLATRGKKRDISRGHVEGDPLFWGDLCREHVTYVRNFVFDDLNALAVCPEQPYHDPSRPYVNFWFTSTDGASVERFLRTFTEEKIQRLEQAGGLCIAYVHFGYRFVENGKLNAAFQKRVEFLAGLKGWFAPASEILDYLRNSASPQERTITPKRLRKIEGRWLCEKFTKGTT
jgi:hypothetical protein